MLPEIKLSSEIAPSRLIPLPINDSPPIIRGLSAVYPEMQFFQDQDEYLAIYQTSSSPTLYFKINSEGQISVLAELLTHTNLDRSNFNTGRQIFADISGEITTFDIDKKPWTWKTRLNREKLTSVLSPLESGRNLSFDYEDINDINNLKTLFNEIISASSNLEIEQKFWQIYKPGATDLAMALAFTTGVKDWDLVIEENLCHVDITTSNGRYRIYSDVTQETTQKGQIVRSGWVSPIIRLKIDEHNQSEEYLPDAWTTFEEITDFTIVKSQFGRVFLTPTMDHEFINLALWTGSKENPNYWFNDGFNPRSTLIQSASFLIQTLENYRDTIADPWQDFEKFLETYNPNAPKTANAFAYLLNQSIEVKNKKFHIKTSAGERPIRFSFPDEETLNCSIEYSDICHRLKKETVNKMQSLLSQAWDQFLRAGIIDPNILRSKEGNIIINPKIKSRKGASGIERYISLELQFADQEGQITGVQLSDFAQSHKPITESIDFLMKQITQKITQMNEIWPEFMNFTQKSIPQATLLANVLKDTAGIEGAEIVVGERTEALIDLSQNIKLHILFDEEETKQLMSPAVLYRVPQTEVARFNFLQSDIQNAWADFVRGTEVTLPKFLNISASDGILTIEFGDKSQWLTLEDNKVFEQTSTLAQQINSDAEAISELIPDFMKYLSVYDPDRPEMINSADLILNQQKITHRMIFDEKLNTWFAVCDYQGTEVHLGLYKNSLTAAIVTTVPRILSDLEPDLYSHFWQSQEEFLRKHPDLSFELGNGQFLMSPDFLDGQIIIAFYLMLNPSLLNSLARGSLARHTNYQISIPINQTGFAGLDDTFKTIFSVVGEGNSIWQKYEKDLPNYVRRQNNSRPEDPNTWLMSSIVKPLEKSGFKLQIVINETALDKWNMRDMTSYAVALMNPDYPNIKLGLTAQLDYQNTHLRIGLVIPGLTRKQKLSLGSINLFNSPNLEIVPELRDDQPVFFGITLEGENLTKAHEHYSTQNIVKETMRQLISIIPSLNL